MASLSRCLVPSASGRLKEEASAFQEPQECPWSHYLHWPMAVDAQERLYFENQIVTERVLANGLTVAAKSARAPLTLVIHADKSVSCDTLARLSLLARERRDVLSTRFEKDVLDRCANFLYAPGISVGADAAVAMSAGGVTGMHDPTEGGFATALWEVSDASGLGIQVDFDAPGPFLPEVVLCEPFGLDPWGLIASGALLFTAKPDRSDALVSAFGEAGIKLFRIGSVVESPGVHTQDGAPLKRPARDEIARIYE